VKKLCWMPFFGDAFYSSPKVVGMTVAERGAYLALLWFAWKDPQCSLPAEEELLHGMTAWTSQTHGSWKKVRTCFTKHPDDRKRLYNARLYEEWLHMKEVSAKRRQVALKQRQVQPVQPLKPVRPTQGFESVSKIADKVLPPV